MSENVRFWLFFTKTRSLNSGTGYMWRFIRAELPLKAGKVIWIKTIVQSLSFSCYNSFPISEDASATLTNEVIGELPLSYNQKKIKDDNLTRRWVFTPPSGILGGNIETPYNTMMDSNACTGLKTGSCPVKAGDHLVFHSKINVLPSFPTASCYLPYLHTGQEVAMKASCSFISILWYLLYGI